MGARTDMVSPSLFQEMISGASCSATVADLKINLERKLGIYRARFTILYEGDIADDDIGLHDIDADEAAVIIKEGKDIAVTYTVEGTPRKRSIKFLPDNKMEELMKLVCEYESIPIAQQQLIFNGSVLPTTGTLQAVGLVDAASVLIRPKTITLQLRFPDDVLVPMQATAVLEVEKLKGSIKALKSEYEHKIIHVIGLCIGHTLGEYNIKDGRELKVQILESKRAPVYVRTLTGEAVVLYTDLNERVEYFKWQLQNKQGVPHDQQRLIFAGTQLEDGQLLADYKIQTEATLHLVLRLRGC